MVDVARPGWFQAVKERGAVLGLGESVRCFDYSLVHTGVLTFHLESAKRTVAPWTLLASVSVNRKVPILCALAAIPWQGAAGHGLPRPLHAAGSSVVLTPRGRGLPPASLIGLPPTTGDRGGENASFCFIYLESGLFI